MLRMWFTTDFPNAVASRVALMAMTAALFGADPQNVNRLLAEGSALSRQARYEDAERVYRLALAEAEAIGVASPFYAEALNSLGTIRYRRGHYRESVSLFQQAISLQERLGNAAKTIDALNNLGTAYRQLGQFKLAEEAYLSAIRSASDLPVSDPPELHHITVNLAILRMHMGNWTLALQGATDAAESLRRSRGEDDLDYAAALSAQALVQSRLGDFYRAERLARRVRTIRERKLSGDHPEIARAVNNIGEVVLAQKRLKEAEKLFDEAYRSFAATLGDEHIDTIGVLNNLATVRLTQRQASGVVEMLERALASIDKSRASRHPSALRVHENLATAYLQSGRAAEAEAQIRRTVERFEESLGRDNVQLVRTLNNAGEIFRRSNRLDEAESYFRRAVEIGATTAGWNHPNLPAALANYALLLKAKGRKKESRDMQARSRELAKSQAATSLVGHKIDVADLRQ